MKQLTAGVTRWWVGRDNATLPEPTSSHANCLETRRLPPVGCTLCWHAFDFKTPLLFTQALNTDEFSPILYFQLVVQNTNPNAVVNSSKNQRTYQRISPNAELYS